MKKSIFWGIAASLVSGVAYAHPGHDLHAGFAAGFMHPLTGWDHLLVMLSLGIWAARRPAQGWQLPVLFVGVMALAAMLAMTWLPFTAIELLVAASVLLMGVMLIVRLELAHRVQLGMVTVFAAAHGYVHGAELGQSWGALTGMVLATALLHLVGWWLGRLPYAGLQSVFRLLGGLMVALGAYWMLA